MSKIIKRKLISSVICIILGIISLILLAVCSKIFNEDILSYISGFSSGLIIVGIVTLIKYTRIMKNNELSKKIENTNNDERLKYIHNQSLAVTLKISIIVEVIISSICTVNNKTEIANLLGCLIGIKVFLYLIIYLILSKKS